MSAWKIPLPKEKPATGTANVGLAFMIESGSRVEFAGKVTAEAAKEALQILIKNQVRSATIQSDTAHVEGDTAQGGGKP